MFLQKTNAILDELHLNLTHAQQYMKQYAYNKKKRGGLRSG